MGKGRSKGAVASHDANRVDGRVCTQSLWSWGQSRRAAGRAVSEPARAPVAVGADRRLNTGRGRAVAPNELTIRGGTTRAGEVCG